MLIGKLAKASGLSRDTLRYYEKLGLLHGKIHIDPNNGYKHYDESLLERLTLIRQAKLVGFTLNEICALMNDWENDKLSTADKEAIFREKLDYLSHRIDELQSMRSYLQNKLERLFHDV